MLNPLSILLLSDSVRDGETARVRFDGPRNRLVVLANHNANVGVESIESNDGEDIEIEEMD